jgi:hypothetical protein
MIDEDSPWGTANVAHCRPSECPRGPHRGPEGPNEDLSQCLLCWSPSYSMRAWGETYGEHLPDCSLPIWHESYCEPGGHGHPKAPKIRGYWPVQCKCGHVDFPHADRMGACAAPDCDCVRYVPA